MNLCDTTSGTLTFTATDQKTTSILSYSFIVHAGEKEQKGVLHSGSEWSLEDALVFLAKLKKACSWHSVEFQSLGYVHQSNLSVSLS